MMRLRNGLLIGLLAACPGLASLEIHLLGPVPASPSLLPLQSSSRAVVNGNAEDRERIRAERLLQKSKAKKEEKEDELESFEDDLLVLTRVSEQLMMNQLALRSFRCQERIVVTENVIKPESSTTREFVSAYEVKRKAETRANPLLTFAETRKSGNPDKDTDPLAEADFPIFEKPFSGFIIQSFSFENRLSNDFKKAPNEKVAGRDCLKFGFETVPELSSGSIAVMGNNVALRQHGFVWLDGETNHLVRVSARLTKLPKGCKAYEYEVNFSHGRLFGKEIQLPTHIELRVQLKDKSYHVEQHYNQFEPL